MSLLTELENHFSVVTTDLLLLTAFEGISTELLKLGIKSCHFSEPVHHIVETGYGF